MLTTTPAVSAVTRRISAAEGRIGGCSLIRNIKSRTLSNINRSSGR
jgi:hypothetical protein